MIFVVLIIMLFLCHLLAEVGGILSFNMISRGFLIGLNYVKESNEIEQPIEGVLVSNTIYLYIGFFNITIVWTKFLDK